MARMNTYLCWLDADDTDKYCGHRVEDVCLPWAAEKFAEYAFGRSSTRTAGTTWSVFLRRENSHDLLTEYKIEVEFEPTFTASKADPQTHD